MQRMSNPEPWLADRALIGLCPVALLPCCSFALLLFFKNEKHTMATPTVGASGAIEPNQKRSAE
jgi:hypothetical protein